MEKNPELRERILIIEDELPMRTVLCDCLERQGYRVLSAEEGERGLERALKDQPDLIVLDIMLPKLDGLALCAELRRLDHRMPILMLTAKGRLEDRVRGLDTGADDYLVKPFSRDELLARIRALLRRHGRAAQPIHTAELGPVKVDFDRQEASRQGAPLHLTAKELAMLRLMTEHAGEVISRDRFLDVVWGYAAFPTTRTVDRHVASLRAKIETDPEHPRFIQTVHTAGYRLLLGP
ncbi:MAG TPA: response regulator transcription factor [Candidatus Paceibacterota bacterium]|nr:response regulator transcription factor [Verrucomicrobiota bacterium]HRY49720.1 response regulator transcription factor [Candidatus Paceibacterota bacterium]HSA01564.1 response regulator transcription factor [Candidatus Paceibacterota bacterium]